MRTWMLAALLVGCASQRATVAEPGAPADPSPAPPGQQVPAEAPPEPGVVQALEFPAGNHERLDPTKFPFKF